MLERFFSSDTMGARLVRTIVQGLLSVAIVCVPLFAAHIVNDPQLASIITAAIMCVLSPIMSLFKTGEPEDGLYEYDEED